MGGFGSGDWDRHTKKTTVEECRSLDVNQLARSGMLRVGAAGDFCWEQHCVGGRHFFVKFSTLGDDAKRILRLSYRLCSDCWDNSEDAEFEDVTMSIRLQATPMHFGGERWWFVCPLVEGSVPCNRRVCKLYLPPGSRYFGCRICHDLTYESCQQAHQLERLLAPGRVEKIMRLSDWKG